MSAKNVYHDAVIRALEKDGWTITDDPLTVKAGFRKMKIDLGAERNLIGAIKGVEKIAIEVASFLSESPVTDLERVIGQYLLYLNLLGIQRPDTTLFAGIPVEVADNFLREPIGEIALRNIGMRIVAFDPASERIVRWKN